MLRAYGRFPSPERGQKRFLIRDAIRASAKPRSRLWECPAWLDQMAEGSCVGHAVAHELAAQPMQAAVSSKLARRIYRAAQKIDTIPGEAYEGTTVDAGMRAAAAMGYYDEWRWAYNLEDLILGLSHRGPAVIGVNWYRGMEKPRDGFIFPTGRHLGGHAIAVIGYNQPSNFFRLRNSWGKDWGLNGDCFIFAHTLDLLMRRQGEAAIPIIRKDGHT